MAAGTAGAADPDALTPAMIADAMKPVVEAEQGCYEKFGVAGTGKLLRRRRRRYDREYEQQGDLARATGACIDEALGKRGAKAEAKTPDQLPDRAVTTPSCSPRCGVITSRRRRRPSASTGCSRSAASGAQRSRRAAHLRPARIGLAQLAPPFEALGWELQPDRYRFPTRSWTRATGGTRIRRCRRCSSASCASRSSRRAQPIVQQLVSQLPADFGRCCRGAAGRGRCAVPSTSRCSSRASTRRGSRRSASASTTSRSR